MTAETVTTCLVIVALGLLVVGTAALKWGTQVIDRDDTRRPTFVRVGHRCLFFAVVVGLIAFAVDPDPGG